MEEVARFLERYQKQRQQQQQLQQQETAAQKHNYHGNMEQISRSKSLYQVYATAGEHDKSTMGSNLVEDSSASYLRARSSTNLIDLKQNSNSTHKIANTKGHSKDDHNFETGGGLLTPAQSYSAFKDYTW